MIEDTKGTIIDFGVPELDELFGRLAEGKPDAIFADPGESLSVCILGADGTGKSVFALHLASRYASRYGTRVIYFSEDLGFTRADRVFKSFGLHKPAKRCETLQLHEHSDCTHNEVDLSPDTPRSPSDKGDKGIVHFVDLQARTTGDDWSYILESVARLPVLSEKEHLACIIIDNIDALQLVNAGVDQFGEERTRWSRLDQLTTLAKHRCHVVLVSGEPEPGRYLDEQYNADYVLHLYIREQEGYQALTLQVEKARGQANTRGPHSFAFRSGAGTSTGYQENPDNPRRMLDGKCLSYVRVFHSLDYVYSKYMASDWQGYVPGTGIPVKFASDSLKPLNELLPNGEIRGGTTVALVGPRQTFKGSFVTAFEAGVVADAVITEPVRIAAVKLYHQEFPEKEASEHYAHSLWEELTRENIERELSEERNSEHLARCYKEYRNLAHQEDKNKNGSPFLIVHLTTEDVDSWQVAYRIARYVSNDSDTDFQKKYGTPNHLIKETLAPIEARLICRRLEIHSNSAAVHFSIIKECVSAGIQRAFSSHPNLTNDERRKAGKVVVTIGDWAQIEERYPDAAKESKFLPLLLFYLRRQGCTTLITESRADSRSLPSVYQSHSRLVQDADQTIFTWRVLGDSRVAIAAVPKEPFDDRIRVREVRADHDRGGCVKIDASLERYQGFESGDPKPVKLHLKLLGQTPAQQAYAKEMATLLEELSEGELEGTPLVEATKEMEYELLRDVIYLMGDTRLSHTHLVMVDEFWEAPHSLQSLKDYLDSQPTDTPGKRFFGDKSRRDIFDHAFDDLGVGQSDPFLLTRRKEDRIPYTWDFGFILSRPDAWERTYSQAVPVASREFDPKNPQSKPSLGGHACPLRIFTELRRFCDYSDTGKRYQVDIRRQGTAAKKGNKLDGSKSDGIYGRMALDVRIEEGNKKGQRSDLLGWRIFLEACCIVARSFSDRSLRPFDIDLTAPEALTATVLEIWFSEIKALAWRASQCQKHPSMKTLDEINGLLDQLNPATKGDGISFIQLLVLDERNLNECNEWAIVALYFALRLLAEVFEPDMLQDVPGEFDIQPRRPFPATAVRHWYATAVRAVQEEDVPGYLASRLPGHFTTRGDWYLGVARGSKSIRIAHDALDKLSSTRANFHRLQHGVGLPTRRLPEPDFLRTALMPYSRSTALPYCTYKNLISLGGDGKNNFDWIFRSRIIGYRFHSTPLRKWIFRVLREWVNDRTNFLSDWKSTFEVYDQALYHNDFQLEQITAALPEFSEFRDRVGKLIKLLKDVNMD
jgi:hypothetical protein